MREATEIWNDGSRTTVLNTTDFSAEMISTALADTHPEVASMIRWGREVRRGGLFERDKYLTPEGIFAQMKLAQKAAENDDVVAGVLETTEALTFNTMSVRCDDPDEENIWNQILDDIDLETRIREMWREMFTVSQFYCAGWWDVKDYKVKGRNKDTGVQRKKAFQGLRVPTALTLLDPMKVVPVGNFMFGQETLAWISTREEANSFDNILSGREQDATVQRLLTSRYIPREEEWSRLGKMNIGGSTNLYSLNPDTVWRLTATRSYKPFADIRMKSVFELLDMKNLLRELDRVLLLGATNFIVLIRKGSENMPARDEELAALQASVRTLSQIPVIVGDHRLTIDIITPKIDMSLQPEKYNTIDSRITARLYGMFMTGNYSAGTKGDDSMKLIRIVARGLESGRNKIKRAVEKKILKKIYDLNDQLTSEPTLVFHPKSVAIAFDPGLAAYILDVFDRDAGISIATVLEQIDLDIDEEALKKERQEELYGDVFNVLTPLQDPKEQHKLELDTMDQEHKNQLEVIKKTPAPVVAAPAPAGGKAAPVKKKPANADPKSGGRSGGGNRSGGGAAPGSGQGQTADPRRRAKS